MDEYQYSEDVNWGLLRLWGRRSGLRVLDVGCGFATTTEYMQKLGNHVTGVEESADACRVASTRIERVVHADLQDAQLAEPFDVLIFADVLEHVARPLDVLQSWLQRLAPNGSVFVSLPNVGLWSVRFAHLAGQWNYGDTGVLDRTHLRFFTRKTARRLLAEAGLEIVATTHNPGLVRPFVPLAKRFLSSGAPADALLHSKPYRLYLKTAYPIERALASLWPGMLAFQMIFEAKRAA
ncbi:MAG TPA: class I SAM-dependent methyltransferase [Thermoanaerobaculia bacterium]|nr:class I SAM-dependent methyltransferase [Thermoanaerobaculia bacterium]